MKIKEYIKKNLVYIIAFLIPWLVVFVHSIIRDSWLMGGGSILKGDTGLQYYPLYIELWEKVHSGESLFYSWNAGGGFDFFLNFAYYLVSPFTLLVLAVPRAWVENMVQVVMVLKWAGISVSMVYYFRNTKYNRLQKHKTLISFVLGMAFVLSNCMIVYVAYFNWNDVLILFPFLLLQIEKLVEDKSWKTYYVLLTIAMLCNFYMAYQVCIFLFIWFLLQFKKNTKEKIKKVLVFIGSSVLAAMSSLVVILPCVMGVANRYSVDSANEKAAYIRMMLTSLTDMIPKFFVLDDISDVMSMKPNLYFSIGALVLFGLSVFIKEERKNRLKYGVVIVFLVCSLLFGALSLVWHGFSIPNGVYHRFLYLLIFMCLFLLLEVFQYVSQIRLWQVVVAAVVETVFLIIGFINITVYQDFLGYLVTILLLVLYQIVLVLCCKKSITISQTVLVFSVLMLGELFVNVVYQFDDYDINLVNNTYKTGAALALSEEVELKAGERVNILQSLRNAGLVATKPGDDIFLSYSNGKNILLHERLGMDAGINATYGMYGASPLLNLFFNVHYGISDTEVMFSDTEVIKDGKDGMKLYQMKRLAGLGYMVNEDIVKWHAMSAGPFEAQNEFVRLVTGEDDIFDMVYPEVTCMEGTVTLQPDEKYIEGGYYLYTYSSVDIKGDNMTQLFFTVPEDMDLYVVLNNSISGLSGIMVEGEWIYFDTENHKQQTFHIGNVKKGQEIAIGTYHEMEQGEENTMWCHFAKFNEANFQRAYEKLSKNIYEIDGFDSDYVKGHITVDESGLMMTSIQAMDGFTVYVDGTESDYETVGEVMIAVPLSEGEHVVEFKYQTPYFKEGAVASLIGIGIFAILCVTDGLRREKSQKK